MAALSSALLVCMVLPWAACLLFFTFLHCTFASDRRKALDAKRGAEGEPPRVEGQALLSDSSPPPEGCTVLLCSNRRREAGTAHPPTHPSPLHTLFHHRPHWPHPNPDQEVETQVLLGLAPVRKRAESAARAVPTL